MDKLPDCHSRARIVGVAWVGVVSVTTWFSFLKHTNDNWWIIIIGCSICLFIQLLTLMFYAIDKCLAKIDGVYNPQCIYRIPESFLTYFLVVIGGGPGGGIAMTRCCLNHKTSKPSFQEKFIWSCFYSLIWLSLVFFGFTGAIIHHYVTS